MRREQDVDLFSAGEMWQVVINAPPIPHNSCVVSFIYCSLYLTMFGSRFA